MIIIYKLTNRKLNNDIREYLQTNDIRYHYYKDYQQRVRIVYILDTKLFDSEALFLLIEEKRGNYQAYEMKKDILNIDNLLLESEEV